jgi:hypothetical protein
MTAARPAIAGATAGVVATIVMSLPMVVAQRLRLMDREPPEEVTEQVAAVAGLPLAGVRLQLAATSAHLAFGGIAGAFFNVALRRVFRVAAAKELAPAYAVSVWALSYRGILPTLGLVRSTAQAGGTRDAVMLFSHLVFGVVLGRLVG